MLHLQRSGDHPRRPWRNGGGTTAEVACAPAGADAGYAFDSGLPVRCEVTAPTRDLNVMTRRGRASASVEVLRWRRSARRGSAPLASRSRWSP